MTSQFEVKREPDEGDNAEDDREDYEDDYAETDDTFILSSVNEEHQHMVHIKEEAIEDTDDEDITERSDEEDPLGDPLATDNQDNEENSEEENSCEICCKKFTSRTRLIKHLSNVHKKFIDEETRRSILEESKVNRRPHQKPPIQDYKCDVCEKIFKRSDHLKRHVKIHVKNFNLPQRILTMPQQLVSKPSQIINLIPKSSTEQTKSTKPVLLISGREIEKPNLMISNVIKSSSSNSVILKQRDDVKPKQQHKVLSLITSTKQSDVNRSNPVNVILSRQNDVIQNAKPVTYNSNDLKLNKVTKPSDIVPKPDVSDKPYVVFKPVVTSNSSVFKSCNSSELSNTSIISSLKLKSTATLLESSKRSTQDTSIKSVSAVTLTAISSKTTDSLTAKGGINATCLNDGKQQLKITSKTVLKPKNTEPKKVFLVEKQTLSASNLIPASSKPYVTQTNSNVNFLKRKRSEDETPSDFSSTKIKLEADDNITATNRKKEIVDDLAKTIEITAIDNTAIKKEIIDGATNDFANIKKETIDEIAVPSIKQEAIEEDDLVQPLNCLEVTMDEKDTDKAVISLSSTASLSTMINDKPIEKMKDNMEDNDQTRTRNTLLCRLCDGGVRIPVSNVLVHTTTVHMNPNKSKKFSCPYCPMEFDAYESCPGTRVGCYLLTHVRSKHRLNACGFCGVRMPKQGLHRCKQMEGGDNKMHYVRQSKKVESETKLKIKPISKKNLRMKKKIEITEVEEVIYKDNTIDMENPQLSDNPEPIDILDADIYKISKEQISLENMENHLLKCKFCDCNLQNSHVRQHYEMRHFEMFSRMNKHFCPHCDFETESVIGLWSHFTTVHTRREKCDNCNVRFTNLASHYEKCIGLAKMKSCNMCGKVLKNLSNHSCPFDKTTPANQPIECDKCGNIMKEKYLRIHQKNHCVGGNSSSFSNFRTERQPPKQPPKFEI